MSYHPDDTICAIATAPGGALRGMVRISGPSAIDVAARIAQPNDGTPIDAFQRPTAFPGNATIQLHDNETCVLPCDVFLWPTARSYTRQPVAELHTLGSPPLLEALVASACREGARLAEPGEFTLRAFLAGRIDLTQAEAVLGVIDARGNHELDTALTQLAGGLARPLQQLREDLLQLLAELEAGLDFVDEDIEFVSRGELDARLGSANHLLADVDQQMSSRSTIGPSVQVALVGPPNAGKSSLFNAIVARCDNARTRDLKPTPAIVSPQRGTTRDYLTAAIDLNGVQCELVDTAGVDDVLSGAQTLPLSAGECPIEQVSWQAGYPLPALSQKESVSSIDAAAQSLAAERREQARIRLFCIDTMDESSQRSGMWLDDAKCDVIVLTKTDRASPHAPVFKSPSNVATIVTSSHTGQGLDQLCAHLRALIVNDDDSRQGRVVATTADRCRESIRLAQSAIGRAIEIIRDEGGDELAAAELRIALAELGKVVGVVYTDDLLDRIFSTFCIGK